MIGKCSSQKCETCQNDKGIGWRAVWNDPTSVFTGIIAVFTIFIFGAALWEVFASNRASERQLRAYVSATFTNINTMHLGGALAQAQMSLDKELFGAVCWGVSVELTNHGQTPAYDVQYFISVLAADNPLPADMNFPAKAIPANSQPRTVLFPQASSSGKSRGPEGNPKLTPSQLPDIAAKKDLYAFALVSYADTFGERRETRICAVIKFTQPAFEVYAKAGADASGTENIIWGKYGDRSSFEYTSRYNDAT